MSAMERRLQLLLDQHRYHRVRREAESSGRSVAAVIREAIDVRFAEEEAAEARSAALHDLLAGSETPAEPGDDWAVIRADLEAELVGRHPDDA